MKKIYLVILMILTFTSLTFSDEDMILQTIQVTNKNGLNTISGIETHSQFNFLRDILIFLNDKRFFITKIEEHYQDTNGKITIYWIFTNENNDILCKFSYALSH